MITYDSGAAIAMAEEMSAAKRDMMEHLGLLPRPAPKKRVRALPPTRAACDTVMDADRLPMHVAQCLVCAERGAVLQVSNDGQAWVNYNGTIQRTEDYRHIRCVATRPVKPVCVGCGVGEAEVHKPRCPKVAATRRARAWAIKEVGEALKASPFSASRSAERVDKAVERLTNEIMNDGDSLSSGSFVAPTCRDCRRPLGREWIVHRSAGGVTSYTCPPCFDKEKAKPAITCCRSGVMSDGHLHDSRCRDNVAERAAWMAAQSGVPYTGPERLPRLAPPPLVHSYGIEDPALPDV